MTPLTSSESAPKKSALSPAEALRRWIRVWKAFKPYARPHRKSFWRGLVASFGVVACHLALPLPIKAMVDNLIKGEGTPSSWSPFELGLVFFALSVLLGLAEYQQRLWVARFAIAWVRDIRAESFRAASRVDPRRLNISTGDLVARLVGDTARLKAGLKGFITHFATNGLLLFGISIVLFSYSWQLGLVFLLIGIGIASLTWWGTWRLYNRYRILRKKEGKLATRIQGALGGSNEDPVFARVNKSSGKHEATVVRIQGQTTLLVHLVLGSSILLIFWLGMNLVETKSLLPGDLVLVILYGLKITRPGVRLARQGTRIGKMLALGDRLEKLLREGIRSESEDDALPLQKGIQLKDICLKDSKKTGRKERLSKVSLEIHAGQRVAVLGNSGAGKSSLLSILAAQVAPTSGRLRWDGFSYKRLSYAALSKRIAFQSASPFWLRQPLCDLLPVKDPHGPTLEEILEICGLNGFVEHLSQGKDTKLASDELSSHQSQALALARVLVSDDKDLVLLDEPFPSLTLSQVKRVLDLLSRSRWRTFVIAMTRQVNLSWFDRVIVLGNGEVIFDGTPRAWQLVSANQEDA